MELITTFVLMLSLIADGYIELASQYRALATPEKKFHCYHSLQTVGSQILID